MDLLKMISTYSGKILQKRLNENGSKLKVDGVIGSKTKRALDKFMVDQRIEKGDFEEAFRALNLSHYLVLKNKLSKVKENPVTNANKKPSKAPQKIKRKNSILPKGIHMPKIVEVPGISFSKRVYRTAHKTFEGMVLHYTVSDRTAKSAKAVLNWLSKKGLMCMVMDGDGIIYIPKGFDIFRHYGAHAGSSGWDGDNGLNDEYAGMEVCCWGKGSKKGPFRTSKGEANIIAGTYQQYTAKQESEYTNFIMYCKFMNPNFDLNKNVGHDEARDYVGKRGHKQDPGASLSMTMPKYRKMLNRKWAKIVKENGL